MKKLYTLEDVQAAVTSIRIFIDENLGKNVKTDPLLKELSSLNYEPATLDEACTVDGQFREIEKRHHNTVMTELKTMNGASRWLGNYVMHDLIGRLAHFGFTVRYAKKDQQKETE